MSKQFNLRNGWVIDFHFENDKEIRKFGFYDLYYDGQFYVLWLWFFAITLSDSHHMKRYFRDS